MFIIHARVCWPSTTEQKDNTIPGWGAWTEASRFNDSIKKMIETNLQGFYSDVSIQILQIFRHIRWLCLWIGSICGRLFFATEKCIVKCRALPLNSFPGLPSFHRSFFLPSSVFPHPPTWVRHPSYPSSVSPMFSAPSSIRTAHVAEEVLPLFPQRRFCSSRLDGSPLAPPLRLVALIVSLHPSSARLRPTTTL
jgi:hypothetical protein